MSSIADMSADSGDLALALAPPAAGRNATDRATRSASMVRPMFMGQTCDKNSRFLGRAVKWRIREVLLLRPFMRKAYRRPAEFWEVLS
jgi:hypothetical protein